MRFRGRRLLRGVSLLMTMALTLALTSACVDQDSNTQRFCARNADLLDASKDDEVLTEDQAIFFSDEVEKSMRFAEDGTREIRSKGRKLADAYSDVREIAGDDDVPNDEIDETYEELRERRNAMRDACAEVDRDDTRDGGRT